MWSEKLLRIPLLSGESWHSGFFTAFIYIQLTNLGGNFVHSQYYFSPKDFLKYNFILNKEDYHV